MCQERPLGLAHQLGMVGMAIVLGISLLLTAAHASSVRSDHPRIWLTPERLATLQARVAANTIEWQQVKQTADRYLDPGTTIPSSGASWYPLNFAIVYLMTGDTRYSDRAIQVIKDISIPYADGAITNTVGLHIASNGMVPTAVIYDWCYGRLSADDRSLLRQKMTYWVDYAAAHDWLGYPGHNYYFDWIRSEGISGLSLYGDDTKASGYLDDARSRYANDIVPYLNTYGAGGYWEEGPRLRRVPRLLADLHRRSEDGQRG